MFLQKLEKVRTSAKNALAKLLKSMVGLKFLTQIRDANSLRSSSRTFSTVSFVQLDWVWTAKAEPLTIFSLKDSVEHSNMRIFIRKAMKQSSDAEKV